ncbi:hypothetical protein ACQB60_19245 [Actinomycetota bacterium Odt1-20B]
MRTKTRKNWKLGLLGATAALALATTACEPSGGDDDSGDSKPSPAVSKSTENPSKPDPDKTASPSKPAPGKSTPAPGKTGDDIEGSGGANSGGANSGGANSGGANSGGANSGGSGGGSGKDDYADRQTPPGPICANHGKGPYGRLVGYLKDGTDDKEGNDLLTFHIGSYDCSDGSHPILKMEGGGNHTTNMAVDEKHLKVVVAGQLASEMGGKEVDTQKFLSKLGEMDKKGQLGLDQDPVEFYYQMSGDSKDDAYGGGKAVYLYQVNTLGG